MPSSIFTLNVPTSLRFSPALRDHIPADTIIRQRCNLSISVENKPFQKENGNYCSQSLLPHPFIKRGMILDGDLAELRVAVVYSENSSLRLLYCLNCTSCKHTHL